MEKRKNGMEVKCDHCGGPILPGHELVLRDTKWAEIVKKSKSPYKPRYTLLCPECIEALNGGPLKPRDLLRWWHHGSYPFIGAIPMNLWYYQDRGMMEDVKPFILRHMRSSKIARKAWENHGIKEKDLL
jgi:hypothetical protein